MQPAQDLPVFHRAVSLHGSGQLAEAAVLFAEILEHYPDHFPSLQRLGGIRRYEHRLEESLALLQRAVACSPTAAEVYNSLGNTLNSLGRPEEAIEQYQRAVLLRADFPEAYLNLANSFKALQRWNEAESAYRAAIASRPGYVDAHTNLGIILGRMSRQEDA